MQIVGVDFGTTNVRIATWDSDEPDRPPEPRNIGPVDSPAMPAVIAFRKHPDGTITTVIAQEADELPDSSDTVVVRNIKRWALSGDPYVRWHLDSENVQSPEWWNGETRCIKVWDEEFPVREVIRQILAEAFRRANLSGEFEWRAGCPVHANFQYRSELAQVLSEFGGTNSVACVIEEPILFLTLAHRRQVLDPGSYIVYDLGGGSFDCALAEVGANGEMTVYAAHGHPLRGGARVDDLLMERLGYDGPPHSLRIAKELLTRSGPDVSVDARTNLSWTDLEYVVDKNSFLDGTVMAMREAYITAKVIWKREESASPVGEIPSLRWGNIPEVFRTDLDGVLLTGGPTKSPLFQERLTNLFGDQRVKPAAELLPVEIPDPELTGLSMGACYAAGEQHNPLYISRLPAKITLRETRTRNQVEYEAYQHFVPNFNPVRPFISKSLVSARTEDAKYELVISDPDGGRLARQTVDFTRASVWHGRQPLLPQEETALNVQTTIRLLIDKLGRIWVYNNGRVSLEVENPPWQSSRQREILNSILERQRLYEEEERGRVHFLITHNPFGWGR